MESPYESRIHQDLQNASEPSQHAALQAELAAYFARVGRFSDAEGLISEIRSTFGDGRSGYVSVLLMCAEGLLAYYRDLSPESHDRFSRAQTLSIAARSGALSALTSAWLAHIDFNLHRHDDMARALRTFISTLPEADLQARCRFSLTLGDAFLVSDQRELSRRWYRSGRDFASRLGDHAAIGAFTYNQAALSVFGCRIEALDASLSVDLLTLATNEVKAASNYQYLARLQSLQQLLDNASASILILQHQYDRAAKLLEALLGSSALISPSSSLVTTRCDLALCYAQLGSQQDFDRIVDSIEIEKISDCSPDDSAVAYGALRDSYDCNGQAAKARYFDDLMAASLEEQRNKINMLRDLLAPFESVEISQD